MSADGITAERAHALLSYDPETGIFRWKVKRGHAVAGDRAGHVSKSGYVSLRIDYRSYYAHRLAWLMIYGDWPIQHIDHRNLDPTDNRICNLREASRSQNQLNRGRPSSNSSGFKGVSWNAKRKKWDARFSYEGNVTRLGCFETAELAHAAYSRAVVSVGGEFARTNDG